MPPATGWTRRSTSSAASATSGIKYIRNYRPDLPYAQDIAYMNEMPTMKEWRRLAAAGELKGPQAIFFQPTKPVEELYDTQADPHEIHNLADDPKYAARLTRLRAAHEKWREDTGDLGLIPEAELNEQRRPGGKWSVTADPEISVRRRQGDDPLRDRRGVDRLPPRRKQPLAALFRPR